MYRNRLEREQEKKLNKKTNSKDTWFRKGGATSTLKVPATSHGTLADNVRNNLEKLRQPPGTKRKVIEDGGTSAKLLLVKSNQFSGSDCNRQDCSMCFQKD